MKKHFFVLCAILALISVSACQPEEKPGTDEVNHVEFRSGFKMSQDVIDNFDLVYDIISNNKSIASGTMSGEFKPVELKSGIADGPFEVRFNFKATDRIFKEWDMWKEYVLSEDCTLALYSISNKGVENELISVECKLQNATFSTFVEENLPEMVSLMEGAISINEKFIIKDNGSSAQHVD